ncbi:hypothetical protein B046DRAFT_00078 [Streptomyces sp. LamerLS-316]|nr:hypothetical protein B046DRAFT_00078 [Streptomyces sp. LamerLS-316]
MRTLYVVPHPEVKHRSTLGGREIDALGLTLPPLRPGVSPSVKEVALDLFEPGDHFRTRAEWGLWNDTVRRGVRDGCRAGRLAGAQAPCPGRCEGPVSVGHGAWIVEFVQPCRVLVGQYLPCRSDEALGVAPVDAE